jgi:putative redox protein
MKITTRMLADDLYEGTNENGNRVLVDMRKKDERVGQSPTELVLSALAGCGAVDIVSMLKKRKKKVVEFTIELEGSRREKAPRYFTRIHCHYRVISPNVTHDELHKVTKLALEKYCSVASSLKAEIMFSVEVVR